MRWPEPASRFVRARDAIRLFRAAPPAIDRADVRDWLPGQLEPRSAGRALVVYHSVFWQYLDLDTQGELQMLFHDAGRRASAEAPLAWLRLEPRPDTYIPAQLRLTLWDGNTKEPPDRLLATTGFHGGPLMWLGA